MKVILMASCIILLVISIASCSVSGIGYSNKSNLRPPVDFDDALAAAQGKCYMSASAYSKVTLKDAASGVIVNAVVSNRYLFYFLAEEDNFQHAWATYYHEFIKEHKDVPIEIHFGKFLTFLCEGEYRGMPNKWKRDHANTLKKIAFDTPMTLEQLGVSNEDELIGKYFRPGQCPGNYLMSSIEYEKALGLNPSFLAMLIDLGYYIEVGDYVPDTIIKKCRPEN